jgi:hypothetical protein
VCDAGCVHVDERRGQWNMALRARRLYAHAAWLYAHTQAVRAHAGLAALCSKVCAWRVHGGYSRLCACRPSLGLWACGMAWHHMAWHAARGAIVLCLGVIWVRASGRLAHGAFECVHATHVLGPWTRALRAAADDKTAETRRF